MSSNVILTQRAFDELKREVRELRQKYSNERSLSRVGVRRHQAVWMPGTSAGYYSFYVGPHTITTDTRTHMTNGASIGSPNAQAYGGEAITHSGGVLTFARDSEWTFQICGRFEIDYKRNDFSDWGIEVQLSTNSGSSWDTLYRIDSNATWPDVALVAGSGASHRETVASQWRRGDFLEGYQIRLTSIGINYGSVRPGGYLDAWLSLFDSISTKESE